MEPQEPLDEFSIIFFHYFFEFPEEDVNYKLLREHFTYVILISLEQFQVATQLDPNVPYDDPQVTGCSNEWMEAFGNVRHHCLARPLRVRKKRKQIKPSLSIS